MDQLTRQFSANVALIAEDGQISVFGQKFSAYRQISSTGRSYLKIQDDPAQANQQMQFEAKDGEFLAGNLAKVSPMRRPVARRTGDQMKYGYGHRVNRCLSIRTQVKLAQDDVPNQVESVLQSPTPPIEATLRRNIGKQIPVFSPLTEHGRFFVPLAAFTHQGHRQQFTITARRVRAWSLKQVSNFSPNIVNHHIHPQAKIVKTVYHRCVSRIGKVKFGSLSLSYSRDVVPIYRSSI